MSINANAWTQLNYICFRIDRANFIKINDPTAVSSPSRGLQLASVFGGLNNSFRVIVLLLYFTISCTCMYI